MGLTNSGLLCVIIQPHLVLGHFSFNLWFAVVLANENPNKPNNMDELRLQRPLNTKPTIGRRERL